MSANIDHQRLIQVLQKIEIGEHGQSIFGCSWEAFDHWRVRAIVELRADIPRCPACDVENAVYQSNAIENIHVPLSEIKRMREGLAPTQVHTCCPYQDHKRGHCTCSEVWEILDEPQTRQPKLPVPLTVEKPTGTRYRVVNKFIDGRWQPVEQEILEPADG